MSKKPRELGINQYGEYIDLHLSEKDRKFVRHPINDLSTETNTIKKYCPRDIALRVLNYYYLYHISDHPCSRYSSLKDFSVDPDIINHYILLLKSVCESPYSTKILAILHKNKEHANLEEKEFDVYFDKNISTTFTKAILDLNSRSSDSEKQMYTDKLLDIILLTDSIKFYLRDIDRTLLRKILFYIQKEEVKNIVALKYCTEYVTTTYLQNILKALCVNDELTVELQNKQNT